MTLGLSLNNYYQYGVEVEDVVEVMPGGSFGFFSVGASLGIPLNVAEEFGAWELALGVNALMLGEGAKAIDGGDSSTKIIATFGLSVGY